MAFGIDDALMTAAASIRLTDTLVSVVNQYRKSDKDIERLIEEVRLTAIDKIDLADKALSSLEHLLGKKKIDLDDDIDTVVRKAPFWDLPERSKLKRIRKSLSEMGDSIYDCSDDVAALVRCKDNTGPFGQALVKGLPRKHEFQKRLNAARSVRATIDVLRSELLLQKRQLQ